MLVIKARNPHQMLPEAMYQVQTSIHSVTRGSRNGPVIQFVEPVTLQYSRPTERVVFWEARDANPFFHLFESLWMLAGRNDVAYPTKFNSTFGQFSDDGVTFHGAYGFRWRKHFGFDQLERLVETLKSNAEDRRGVLQMWDANVDRAGGAGKDYPCNIFAVFNSDHEGRLNMTVYNRSNDLLWGALGANCVHFSMLQEFLAAWMGCEVGKYWQISANMHAYLELNPLLKTCLPLSDRAFPSDQFKTDCPYQNGTVEPFPLVSSDIESWHRDLGMFLQTGGDAMGYKDRFFRRVAIPMLRAYEAFKNRGDEGRFQHAFVHLEECADCDWKLAATQWLSRRYHKALAKARQQPAEQE